MLFDQIGAARITEAFRLCGAVSTHMERRIGDLRTRDSGLANETTAADRLRIMRTIASGLLTGGKSTACSRGFEPGQGREVIRAVAEALIAISVRGRVPRSPRS